MYCGVYAPWDHAPKFLRFSEVIDPMDPIKWFFDAHDIEGHQETLKTWRHYVVNDGFYNDERFGPGVLYHDYELNIRLIEALFLLYLDHQEIDYRRKKITVEQLALEKQKWDWFPYELSEKEMLDPFIIIAAAFEEVKLQEFRDHLSEWLAAALSSQAVDENISPGEIITIYEHLKKMYSAAWIIYKRNRDAIELEEEKTETVANTLIDVNGAIEEAVDVEGLENNITYKTAPHPSSNRKFGMEETAGFIQQHNPTVDVIVHISTTQEPYIHFFLIIVNDDEPLSNEEFALKLEADCKELVTVITFVKSVKWLKAASKQGAGFLGYAYRGENLISFERSLELENEPFHWTTLPLSEIQEIWNDFGKAKEKSFRAAWGHLLLRDYSRCLSLVKQTIIDSLQGLIRLFTGYLPVTSDYGRLLRMTLLFNERFWYLFYNELETSNRVVDLLNSSIDQKTTEPSGPFDLEALNLLVLKTHVLTLIADEEYTNVLRQAEEIESAFVAEEKKN